MIYTDRGDEVEIRELIWTRQNSSHIAKHNVSIEEVEEVLFYYPAVLRTRDNKYIVYGQALSGRYLTIIVVHKGKGRFKVITARDMTSIERRFRRRTGR